MPNPRLFLIDGSGLCYRAYYAISGLATSAGQPTGAVFGFINILNKLLKKDPEYLACCFDVSKDTHRKKIYKDYKINRPSAPEEMISQIGLIKEALSAYHIPALEAQGYEADDLIASVCAKAKANGLDVLIISSDKDLLQLVEPGVSVFDPKKDKEGFVYTEEEVKARFGVGPKSLIDIFALTGDPTDNIPGVKGIGEKTALGLIKEFSGIHNLIEQADKIKSNSLRQAVKDNLENIRLSYELFQLKKDLEIDFNPGEFRRAQPDYARLYDLFKRLEFNRLLKGLPEFGEGDDSSLREDFEPGVESLDNADNNKRAEILDSIRKAGELFFVLDEDKAYFYLREKVYSVSMEDKNFQGLLIAPGVRKVGHNLKEAKAVFLKRGIDVQGMFFDVMLAGYLLEPGLAGFSLSELAFKYLDKRYLEDKLSAPGRLGLIVRLFPVLKEKLKENGLDGLFYELEMPLSDVLARMERNGVKIDTPALSILSRQMEEELISLRSRIYGLNSGSEFNLNSPRQLADALFNRLKLPVVKKTKTGPSTDEEVLRKLAKVHQLPALVLEYRRINKLKSTYVDALPDLIDPLTKRIHASFDQTGTETGRLSSNNPNLQNIPSRKDAAGFIRRAFIAESGSFLISADYSQIELRVLAHFSEDPALISAFSRDMDVHKHTAGLIFQVEEGLVTSEMRDTAKRINFGIIYGMSSFGLSKDLGIPPAQAQAFIDSYFLRYPGVKGFIDNQIKACREAGYARTLLGRRRSLPGINSRDNGLRSFAERQAINSPLQGSAADLIKLAMLNIDRKLKQNNLKSLMVMQIHDELVFEAPEDEVGGMGRLVKEEMEGVYKLLAPLKVNVKAGRNWQDMEAV